MKRDKGQMPRKVRVLFAVGSMAGGGSERQLLGLLTHLDRSRFVPHLYLVSRSGELLPEVPPDVPVFAFEDAHWRPPLIKVPGGMHRSQIRHLADVLREQRIDVVYDRTYHMTLLTAGAVRRQPARRISVAVANPRLDFEFTAQRYRFVKRYLLRKAYRQADRVVAVSKGVRTSLVDEFGVPLDRVTVIYNFLDLDRIDRLAAAVDLAADSSDQDRFRLLAVGRLGPEKGYFDLLQAVRDLVQQRGLGQIHLRILGEGPLRESLQSYVAEHGLAEHVSLDGFQKNPYLFFSRAHLFCLTSVYEGLPNVLLEAMACRLPVLATDCPYGPREILCEGRYGRLVPPANPTAFADAVEDAVRNYPNWQAVVPAARERVETDFSPQNGLRNVEKLLCEVAGCDVVDSSEPAETP